MLEKNISLNFLSLQAKNIIENFVILFLLPFRPAHNWLVYIRVIFITDPFFCAASSSNVCLTTMYAAMSSVSSSGVILALKCFFS